MFLFSRVHHTITIFNNCIITLNHIYIVEPADQWDTIYKNLDKQPSLLGFVGWIDGSVCIVLITTNNSNVIKTQWIRLTGMDFSPINEAYTIFAGHS